jgi:hypothetical protein
MEFWIGADQHKALERIMEKSGAPVAAQIRIAIDKYLKKRKAR